jgi:hypothetical protein
MDLSLASLLSFARDTVADPRTAARQVMAIDLTLQDRWTALAFTAVASTVLFHVSLALLPEGAEVPDVSPVATLALQAVLLVLAVLLIWRVGVAQGGVGTLPDTISLMAWLQFVLLILQVVQILAEVILPPLAAIIGFFGMALFLWLLTHFVAELHGFRSLGRVFAGIVGVMMLVAFVLALVLSPFIAVPA